MSDLQDLIDRNAQLAYEQGVKHERERIVRLLMEKNALRETILKHSGLVLYTEDGPIDISLALIKGEQ